MYNVLSLFNGIGCGYEAFNRAGLPVNLYFSSETDKYCNIISTKNFPKTIHLGDVKNVLSMIENNLIGRIDFLIAGSPCQGFSYAGKQLAFNDPRSSLFFEFVKILNALKKINPNLKFLLENVKMKKEHLDVITSFVGVEPVLIDSALVSAQRRKRYYWCNWTVTHPQDRGILLKDIVHENNDEVALPPNKRHESAYRKDTDKARTLLASMHKGSQSNGQTVLFESLSEYIVPFDRTLQILDKEVERGRVGYFNKGSQGDRVYYIHDKSVTLTGHGGGRGAKTGLYLFGCITPDRVNKRQNGQRFSDGNKFYTLTAQDQHGILVEGYIRKLTPVECERLQTLPDNYTSSVSNSQRYKMLGNGWTVDVIAHLLREAHRAL